jgi:hypothetical protein
MEQVIGEGYFTRDNFFLALVVGYGESNLYGLIWRVLFVK